MISKLLILLGALATLNILVALIILIYFIYRIISDYQWCKRNNNVFVLKNVFEDFRSANIIKKRTSYILIIVIVLSFVSSILLNPAVRDWIGMHNLYFEGDGSYYYYAEFYEYETKETYVLPAKVKVNEEKYYIESVKLPNGKTVEFWADEDFDVTIGKFCDIYDINYSDTGEWGECKLLNQYAYTYNTERQYNLVGCIVILILDFIATILLLYIVFRAKDPTNSQTDN